MKTYTINRKTLLSAIIRFGVFTAVWIILTGGNPDELWLAAIIILGATGSSLALMPPGSLKLNAFELMLFMPWFIQQSVMGGIDVAMRAMRPSMPLQTGFERYPVTLKSEPARVLFMWVISLLPGTATSEDRNGELLIHFLSHTSENIEKLAGLEHRIARLFGEHKSDKS